MAQVGLPVSDISNTGWTPSSGSVLWDCIDQYYYGTGGEPYIRSTGPQTCEVKLSSTIDPVVHTGHVFRLSARATGSGSAEKLTASLYQGSTLIATIFSGQSISRSSNVFNGVPTNTGTTLSTAQASAITDYTDLRVRLTSAAGTGETLDIVEAYLELPNAPITNEGVCTLAGTSTIIAVGHVAKLLCGESTIIATTYLGTFH